MPIEKISEVNSGPGFNKPREDFDRKSAATVLDIIANGGVAKVEFEGTFEELQKTKKQLLRPFSTTIMSREEGKYELFIGLKPPKKK